MRKVFAIAVVISLVASLFAANITRSSALDVALGHAGVASGSASYIQNHLEWENGRQVYDIEFRFGIYDYDYEIDAEDGTILKYSREADSRRVQATGSAIGEDEALRIASADCGLAASNLVRSRQERDDGLLLWSLELRDSQARYEYKIAVNGGSIVEVEMERITSQGSISLSDATALALARVSGATENDIRIYQEVDDGRLVWEGEIRYGGYEYEFEIDASSGRFLDWDRERSRW